MSHRRPELSTRKRKPKLSSPSSSSSSSSSSATNLKIPVSSGCCSHSENNNSMKMEIVKGKEEQKPSGRLCNRRNVFDSVPSQMEVEHAVASLNNLMQAMSSCGAPQQMLDSDDTRTSRGYRRIYDAFQLLLSDPSIKRLVVSLSSDKAVWDAIMRNISLQKFQELPNSDECRRPQISDKEEFTIPILNSILEIIKGKVVELIKGKVMELIENFLSLMNAVLQSPKKRKTTKESTELEGKVRSSLHLSIVILVIVIVNRLQE